MQKAPHELIFVMTGACATPGGIAAENRHTLRVLAQLAPKHFFRLTVLSFLERDVDRAPFLPPSVLFRGFAGSKLRLALALWRHALARPLFVFDHVTLAKPLLPLIVIGSLRAVIFAHGSESWKRMRHTSRWLFRSATLVLTNSEFTLRKMRTRIPRFNALGGMTREEYQQRLRAVLEAERQVAPRGEAQPSEPRLTNSMPDHVSSTAQIR